MQKYWSVTAARYCYVLSSHAPRLNRFDQTKPSCSAIPKTQNRRLYNVLYDIVQVLASLLFNRAEKELLIVQKKTVFLDSCRNITIRLPCIAGFLCRAIFRGCSEMDILVEIRSWRDWNLKFGPNCDLDVD